MPTNCDVCFKRVGTRYCFADSAVMCEQCDHTVHSANKLAAKHERVTLSKGADSTQCDICQDRPAVLFCSEDRALTCRRCDIMIHKANEFTASHHRFLLSGMTIGLNRLPPPGSMPPPPDDPSTSTPAVGVSSRQSHAAVPAFSREAPGGPVEGVHRPVTRRTTRSQASAEHQGHGERTEQGPEAASHPSRGTSSPPGGAEGGLMDSTPRADWPAGSLTHAGDSANNLLTIPSGARGGLLTLHSERLLDPPEESMTPTTTAPSAIRKGTLQRGISAVEEHQLAMEKMKQDQEKARQQALSGFPAAMGSAALESAESGLPEMWASTPSNSRGGGGEGPSFAGAGPSGVAPPGGRSPSGPPAARAESMTLAHELLGLPAMSEGYTAKDVDAAWLFDDLGELDQDLSSLLVPTMDYATPRGLSGDLGPSSSAVPQAPASRGGMGLSPFAGPSTSAGVALGDGVVPEMLSLKRQRHS